MPKRISPVSTAPTDNPGASPRAVPVRMVVVTMDSHMAMALNRAGSLLKQDLPGLTLAIHSADEWGGCEKALADCVGDIGQADLVVVTMLFLDEHVRAVLPALAARRDQCDAMLCAMAAGEIVKLTRLGRLDMSAPATGMMGILKRLRGGAKGTSNSGRGQMKALKNLPKILRFIPGTAQDLRAYFLAMQYWLAGSEDNFVNLMRMMVSRYAAGPRAPASAQLRPAPPIIYPEIGLYHPHAPVPLCETLAALPGFVKTGTVGLLVLRSYVLARNAGHYDGVIAAMEQRGLRVIPAFASGLDAREAIERFFVRDGVATIDAMVSLTGFSLVGGPAYNDARAAETTLAHLNVPYIAAHPVEFQTLADWERDARGLTPVEATMMVALPELDGAISPITFGGRLGVQGEHRHDMAVHPERAATLAARVEKLVRLRGITRAEKKLALVLFCFPPNAGNIGTAAYLSVFQSLFNTLHALRDGGYSVEIPQSVDALRQTILQGNAERFGALANVAARVKTDDHVRRETHLRDIERQWGPAPGRAQSDGASIFVLGAQFGNIFVGLQPGFGYEGDPMRLLFEHGFAPTHAFSAFYRWIREDFGADAVLHFGTHGALEFMPGKQTGLSGACWPDRLIGDLPNFYFYASNNPSEGMLAKRRSGATLISHLTPAVTQAGLYRGLSDLKASLDRWRQMPPESTPSERDSLARLIQAQAAAVDMAQAEPAWRHADSAIAPLAAALLELEYTLIPHGLHIIGEPPAAQARAEMLDAAGVTDPARRAALDQLMAKDHELPALLHALDGGYTRPAPGGDLMRNQDVLPTGRNLHGFDPFRIPSRFAVQDGAEQADRLLARHVQETGALPQTVALVLWGSDNLKNEGAPIAQALWLLGAEPRIDSYGRVAGAQLLPLSQLKRPRIDTVISLSGIFRDLLPLQTKLLAEAALLAACAEEPLAENHVRAHALAHQAAFGGTIEDAALRVFSNGDGAYGANVNQMLDAGTWSDEDELAQAFIRRKGFAYGVGGKPVRHDDVLGALLKTVDLTYQNLESVELGVTTIDHYFDSLGGIAGAARRARGAPVCVYVGDQTRGTGAVRTLGEQVALETRTRALNPKWYEPLLGHGYEGVRNIEQHVTNTLGWSATTGQVDPWVYQQLTETYVLDVEMRQRMASLNPAASAKIANRLIEAHERQYWQPDPLVLESLRQAADELEDRLEGVGLEAAA